MNTIYLLACFSSVSLLLRDLFYNAWGFVVLVVALDCAHCSMDMVRTGTWCVSFLDFGIFLLVRERNVRSSVRFVNVVMTGARVQMRVRHRQVATNIGANPVRNVLLPHGILISFVFTGSWAVQITRLSIVLHAEGELGKLAYALVRLARVTEVEISENCVHIWAWLGVL